MAKPTVVYIPGLGTKYDWFRKVCLRIWRLGGVRVEFIVMDWTDGRDYQKKYEHIVGVVKRYQAVSVIGESAGAAAALTLLDPRLPEVKKIATICGVATNDMPIVKAIQEKAPALIQARDLIPDRVPNGVVNSFVPLIDGVVKSNYAVARGAKRHVVPTIGHFFTAFFCLVFYWPIILQTIRKNGIIGAERS